MKKFKRFIKYFTLTELILWTSSLLIITLSFFIFDGKGYVTYISSIVGVTSLIFLAKGNVIGQILMIAFGTFYGIVSYAMAYYGEMITYLGMTLPMSILALISWLKNPYGNKKAEVKINTINPKEYILLFMLATIVTIIFYFILSYFKTANIVFSTISITTSFIAVYFSFRRSEYFSLAYSINDIIIVVLWVLATIKDRTYISVVTCFAVFFANDLYGFINWKKMKKRQKLQIE